MDEEKRFYNVKTVYTYRGENIRQKLRRLADQKLIIELLRLHGALQVLK
ncbi:MAG: hypothetical protein RRE78_00560 [Acidianus sp.]|jgi:hypothetical protein|nr:hypothetical protein [Acidianus sp.]